MEILSILITVLSVLVAVWFGMKSQRLGRENAELQRRLVALEETRERNQQRRGSQAQVRAWIESSGRNNYRLVLENTGDCEARNLQLQMDGHPFDEHAASVMGDGPGNFLGAHSRATRLLALTMLCAPPFDLSISWEDDSGEPGHYRNTLTL